MGTLFSLFFCRFFEVAFAGHLGGFGAPFWPQNDPKSMKKQCFLHVGVPVVIFTVFSTFFLAWNLENRRFPLGKTTIFKKSLFLFWCGLGVDSGSIFGVFLICLGVKMHVKMLPTIFLESSWKNSRNFPESSDHEFSRKIPGNFPEFSRKLIGNFLEMSWKVSRKVPGIYLETSRNFPGNSLEIFPEISGNFPKFSRKCLGNFPEVSRR